MRPKEFMRELTQDGWKVVRIEGSHHIMKHPKKSGLLVLPMHNKEMATGTLNQLRKDAGLK
jgi:predicted RNA binding protein YcfA (HicA-like mRNA interferase family)